MARGATNSLVFARRLKELRMSDFNRPGATLPGPVKQRSRLSHLSDRLARTFGLPERAEADEHEWEYADEMEYQENGVTPPPWEQVGPRFPIARNGYDRAAVDERIGDLERELAELRVTAASASEVTAEIERIGGQTSAILTVAHDQAHEMIREAREQADRCLADAASNAVLITEGAKRKLHELDVDTDAVWHERARLVDDIRGVATTLSTLADEATERFPAEQDKPTPEAPAAATGAPVQAGEAAETAHAVDRAAEAVEPTAQETAPFDPLESED